MKKTFTHYFRHAFAAAIVIAATIPAFAGDGDSVIVLAKDGSSFTTLISEVDRIELGADKVAISTTTGSKADYAYGDVDRILIGAKAASISDITAAGQIAVWPTRVSTTLNVAGAQAGTPVRVYTLGGALLASAETNADGTLCLDLSAAPAGVCIVSCSSHTVKIIKK